MDIIVQDGSNLGFPIHNEDVRTTALNWATGWHNRHTYHTLENVENSFEKAELFDIDSRDSNGGNAWKIKVLIATSAEHSEEVIFDLREQKLLEICQHEGVRNGVIQCPLTVVARGQFAREGGKSHQEYLDSLESKKLKRIPPKQLVVGGCYTTGSANAEECIYLGKGENIKGCGDETVIKGHVFAVVMLEDKQGAAHLNYLKVLKSPSMKVKTRQLDVSSLVSSTVSHYEKELKEAISEESSWAIERYTRHLGYWKTIKSDLDNN